MCYLLGCSLYAYGDTPCKIRQSRRSDLKPIVRKAKLSDLGQRARPLSAFPDPTDPLNSMHSRAAGFIGIGKERIRCTISEPLRYWLGHSFVGTVFDTCKGLDLILRQCLEHDFRFPVDKKLITSFSQARVIIHTHAPCPC